jgi:hypothetical protein
MLKPQDRPYFVGGQLTAVLGGQAHELWGAGAPSNPQLAMAMNTATASGSTNTKGSYVEITAALADDCYGIYVSVPNSNFARDSLVDVAIGAGGSEVVVLSNLLASSPKSNIRHGPHGLFPIYIRRDTRVAARLQSSAASNTQEVWLTYLKVNPFPRIYRTCETMGAATGDSGGTSIDPGGTINTKGAWTQMIASTSRRIRLLNLWLGNQNNTARTFCAWFIDIGVGGAGSEVVVWSDLRLDASANSDFIGSSLINNLLPVDIPAGSRVAIRAQCDINDATDRLFDAALYGFAP